MRDELISDRLFLDHSCVANRGTSIVNKPCQFPFTHQGVTYDGCTTVGDKFPWCATETDTNGRMKIDEWGYCGKECHKNSLVDSIPPGKLN